VHRDRLNFWYYHSVCAIFKHSTDFSKQVYMIGAVIILYIQKFCTNHLHLYVNMTLLHAGCRILSIFAIADFRKLESTSSLKPRAVSLGYKITTLDSLLQARGFMLQPLWLQRCPMHSIHDPFTHAAMPSFGASLAVSCIPQFTAHTFITYLLCLLRAISFHCLHARIMRGVHAKCADAFVIEWPEKLGRCSFNMNS